MGIGIAYVVGVHGDVPTVVLYDAVPSAGERALTSLHTQIEAAAKKGRFDAARAEELKRRYVVVHSVDRLGTDAQAPGLVIEAAPEAMDLKRTLFEALIKTLPLDTILASNTSSLSITDLARTAAGTGLGWDAARGAQSMSRVIGFHFFNPAQVMKLVEIIPALQTSEDVAARMTAFATHLSKTPVRCSDTPGFLVNRYAICGTLEAIRMLETKVATKEEIDQAIHLGLNAPAGPLIGADYIGLDTVLHVAETIYCESHAPQFNPPVLLKRMVQAGYLGVKSGRGFYDYGGRPKM
ncbi:3-hydroxybutyryl-CoA dehydrogenase [Malassezia sp. CBS 17886]|nr:3-hydroxybutyryl-CoA dehydrogenase [Malassezia sp. CBS 17886]